MKKLCLLVFVMMIAAGMAFAENTSDVDQTGSANTASVDQDGNNYADVDQSGDTNTANIDQGAGSPVTNNRQPGYNGDWIHGAYIDQLGNGNDASIIMRKSSTYSHIYQTGDRNTGSQDIGTSNTKANAKLDGTIIGPNFGALIDQLGDDNEAHQTTITGGYGVTGITHIIIDQDGARNYGEQINSGGWGSKMGITQDGDDNASNQNQDGLFSIAHVDIFGDGNETSQTQIKTITNNYALNSDVFIDITGSLNGATQSQLGEFNLADIDVTGDSNWASQSQDGDSNDAILLQTGDLNSALMEQFGDENWVSLVQSNGSDADLLQSGNLNIIRDIGETNPITSSLNGSTLVVDQLGDSNILNVFQDNAASITVNQTGGDVAFVYQP